MKREERSDAITHNPVFITHRGGYVNVISARPLHEGEFTLPCMKPSHSMFKGGLLYQNC